MHFLIMDKDLLYRLLLGFFFGLLFFAAFFLLESYLGFILSAAALFLISFLLALFYLKYRFAPNQGFYTFLEDYASGRGLEKISKQRTKSGAQRENSAEKLEQPHIDQQFNQKKRPIVSFWQGLKARFGEREAGSVITEDKKGSYLENARQIETESKAAPSSNPKKKMTAFSLDTLRPKSLKQNSGNPYQEKPPWELLWLGLDLSAKKHSIDHKKAYEYILKKEYSKALPYMERLVKRYPAKDMYFNDLAVLHGKLDNPDEAIFILQKGNLINQSSAVVNINLGILYKYQEKRRDAFRCFKDSLNREKNPLSYYHLASLYASTGQFEECRQFLEKSRNLHYPVDFWLVEDKMFAEFLDSAEYRRM